MSVCTGAMHLIHVHPATGADSQARFGTEYFDGKSQIYLLSKDIVKIYNRFFKYNSI
jgi:hypothetical protein